MMPSRFKKEAGMILAEQVVVLGIVGLAMTAALGAAGTGALGLNVSTSRDQAVSLAMAQMEYVKGQGFLPAPASYPLGVAAPSGFSLSTVAEPLLGGDANIQRIQVAVTRNGKPVLSLESLKVNRP